MTGCELLTFRIFALLTTVWFTFWFLSFSCELLTFRIFALLTTVSSYCLIVEVRLWIAYISYLCFIDNSLKSKLVLTSSVVNCLHFVSLLYWQQLHTKCLNPYVGCELLTFRIFALLTTVDKRGGVFRCKLWIAYISYLCFIDNSKTRLCPWALYVVNCLHFVSLLYWQQ